MARKRRKSSSGKSGGSTLFGIMVGLILGLFAAVAVALFVTQVPMPFVDKASRDPARTLLPDVRNAPDPNIGLYGKSATPDATPMMPPPDAGSDSAPAQPDGSPTRRADSLGDFIARLATSPKTPPPAPRSGTTSPDAPAPEQAIVPGVTERSSADASQPATDQAQALYFLQAGAFRSENDAEAIKAQILLLGLQAHVQKAQVGGSTINRVRVGPFNGIDDMNTARAQLGSEQIESSVVRQ